MVEVIGPHRLAETRPMKNAGLAAGVFSSCFAATAYQIFTRSSGFRYSFSPGCDGNAAYHGSMLRTVSAR